MRRDYFAYDIFRILRRSHGRPSLHFTCVCMCVFVRSAILVVPWCIIIIGRLSLCLIIIILLIFPLSLCITFAGICDIPERLRNFAAILSRIIIPDRTLKEKNVLDSASSQYSTAISIFKARVTQILARGEIMQAGRTFAARFANICYILFKRLTRANISWLGKYLPAANSQLRTYKKSK